MAESTTAFSPDIPATPWFPVLAGPVVGVVHEAVGYLMVSQSCSQGFPWFSLGSFSGIRLLMLILTVAAEVVLVAGMVTGFRGWRREQKRENDELYTRVARRARFMSLVGAVMCIEFFLFVIYAGVPVFVMDPCHFL